MIYIGNHLSSTGGFAAMGRHALKLGANTFAFFTRNPRGGKAKDIDEKDAEKLILLMKEHNFGPLVAHAPYTLNLCSDKENVITHPLLQDKPFILETPNEDEGYAKEIAWVKSVMK